MFMLPWDAGSWDESDPSEAYDEDSGLFYDEGEESVNEAPPWRRRVLPQNAVSIPVDALRSHFTAPDFGSPDRSGIHIPRALPADSAA